MLVRNIDIEIIKATKIQMRYIHRHFHRANIRMIDAEITIEEK